MESTLIGSTTAQELTNSNSIIIKDPYEDRQVKKQYLLTGRCCNLVERCCNPVFNHHNLVM